VPRAPASGTGPVPAERPEPISQLVRNGELRMNLNDFASATQIYKRLVERAPDVAGYRLRLALAMARWPPTTREAEREFLEAIRRDPNNPRIHYQFGLYYKNLKLKSRAIEEMRTAVALDPQNEGAREHLKDLSPNDPLLDDLSWGD
jgi:tetratricopeptide (TPR) repeat protein